MANYDATPFIPAGWSVESHLEGENLAETTLYTAPSQRGWKRVEGNLLRKELAKKKVANGNHLDYLLTNQHLVSEEWRGKVPFFWGTIYLNRSGDLCVRYMFWNTSKWCGNARTLDNDWDSYRPALVLRDN